MEWCVGAFLAIHSVKPISVSVAFVAEGSFDELLDPKCLRCSVGDNILLAMVRHERCFAVEHLDRLVQWV